MSDAQPQDDSSAAIRFVLDGQVLEVRGVAPTRTVLQYLREDLGRTGTKEGCAEGDCGACTVVVGGLDAGGSLRYRAINSCVQFLPTLDGKELFTVESLKADAGAGENGAAALHPVQRALVDNHGSQCGFCTPGFVMSLFALYQTQPPPAPAPSRSAINDALAGNLCRCTGYRPIVDAAQAMYRYPHGGADETTRSARLKSLRRSATLALHHGHQSYFAPTSIAELAILREAHPQARILAGGTDVGLWVTKRHVDLPQLIYIGDVAELERIAVGADSIEIGAAVRITDVAPILAQHYPDLGELMRRFASPPIRNAATLGGNIANGSPIGDSMPALIVLGTRLVLRRGLATRELPLEDFYLGYQKTALQPGEFVERVRVPLPGAQRHFRTYKISKRYDQDISAVCAAFCIDLDGEPGSAAPRVVAARVAYGGMAATPCRAPGCERALIGREWTAATVDAAAAALEHDYTPLNDMRASAPYRALVARNLLVRFHLETGGATTKTATRLLDLDALVIDAGSIPPQPQPPQPPQPHSAAH